MSFYFEVMLLVPGYLFGLLIFTVTILPLFYGIPKSLIGYWRNKLKIGATLKYFITFLLWQVMLLGVSIVLYIYFPVLYKKLYNSWGLSLGSLVGFWGTVFSAIFRKSARKDMANDFNDFVNRFKNH